MEPIEIKLLINDQPFQTMKFTEKDFGPEFKKIRSAPEPLLAINEEISNQLDNMNQFTKQLKMDLWHTLYFSALLQLQLDLLNERMTKILNEPDHH